MSIRNWLQVRKERAEKRRINLELNSNQQIIAEKVPELIGLSEVDGMAYVLQQIQRWNKTCSEIEAAILSERLEQSNFEWQSEGLIMPYWGNLWVLRTYQTELGHDIPVAATSFENGG